MHNTLEKQNFRPGDGLGRPRPSGPQVVHGVRADRPEQLRAGQQAQEQDALVPVVPDQLVGGRHQPRGQQLRRRIHYFRGQRPASAEALLSLRSLSREPVRMPMKQEAMLRTFCMSVYLFKKNFLF